MRKKAAVQSTSAHPRSRGENASDFNDANSYAGSSPLTRGKLTHGGFQILPRRLIPAHAGKTVERARASILKAAHPRSRGENTS